MRNTAPDSARLDVVAAIVRGPSDEVLLSQRPLHKHQGGRWEFPGGKVELAETLEQALARELHEELGIDVRDCRPFMTIEHDYPDLCVRLHFREVIDWSGEPHGREGQPVAWFRPEALAALEFPEGNRPVTRALALPDCWAILPPEHDDWRQVVPRLVERGVGGLYLRGAARANVAEMVVCCHEHGLLALVRDDVELAHATRADGVHFTAAALRSGHAERYVSSLRCQARAASSDGRAERGIVSVACHDAAEVQRALALGTDMMLLSPVHSTPTHSGTAPLGWSHFRALAEGLPSAVYALGGLGPDDLREARLNGARGVAGVRAFWLGKGSRLTR